MSKYDEMEAYYEAMAENLTELEEFYADGWPLEKIEAYIGRMTLRAYEYQSELNLPLYRARYAEDFDITDPNQFSYIHNLDVIKMLRYNKDHEAVLYTATHPLIAFKEIEDVGKPDSFYLSVWMPKKDNSVFKLALNINGSGVVAGSNAGKFHQILKDNTGVGSSEYTYLSELGHILEKPGSDYRFSSILASQLFQDHDALMTTSMKSEGKELNVTFNQKATDDLMEIKYLYHCDVPKTNTLAFNVRGIGIPENGHIAWYKWSIDYDSIALSPDCPNPVFLPDLRNAIRTGKGITQCVMQPNVNKESTAVHEGNVMYNGNLYQVEFRVKLG